jgi:predicted DNA-binding protein
MPNNQTRTIAIMLSMSVFALNLIGCQSTYYTMWEKLGKEKRHLLRDQVENSRNDQEEASEAFKDALTRLKEMYGFQGGDLEKMYNRLSDDYDNCNQRAEIIDERIDKIQNPTFRAQSTRKLKDTESRFASLESALITARRRMTPVLGSLKDYVLYLKHNLNAQAIGSLKGEADSIETDVGRLIRDIQRSIQEADAFLEEIEK